MKSKEYLGCANYISNTLGFSKEYIMSYCDRKIEFVLEKIISNNLLISDYFYTLLEKVVLKIINDGFSNNRWENSNNTTLNLYIKSIIEAKVSKLIMDQYKIEVKVSMINDK